MWPAGLFCTLSRLRTCDASRPSSAAGQNLGMIMMHDAPGLSIGVPRWHTIRNRRAWGRSVTADGIEGNLAHACIAG